MSQQRKKTLLREYQEKGRAGGIVDKRFGENDPTVAPEERMLERFTRERQRMSKGVAFNLEREDELTHYGQSLSNMDDFDGAGLGLDDEDDNGMFVYCRPQVLDSLSFRADRRRNSPACSFWWVW